MFGRFFHTTVFALALALVAGCAGQRSGAAVAPAATQATTPAPTPTALAPPPSRADVLHTSDSQGDLACKSNADCVIKDVGSCCGYRPQCLNKDAKTFPEQVKAKCAREGRVSTCGMLAVTGCECVQGQCAAQLQSDNNSLVR